MAYDPSASMQIPGFMEEEELAWLFEQSTRLRTVIEIGCWLGRSASALGASGAQVTTVDHFRGSPSERTAAHREAIERNIELEARDNLGPWPNVRVLALESRQAARIFGFVDMVFIDGDHEFGSMLTDLVLWAPKATKLLCGHDRYWDGVLNALSVYGIPFESGPGSIWYLEKA